MNTPGATFATGVASWARALVPNNVKTSKTVATKPVVRARRSGFFQRFLLAMSPSRT
jgi:hypothetical protein